jgi:hypothetical protein
MVKKNLLNIDVRRFIPKERLVYYLEQTSLQKNNRLLFK